MGITHSWYSKGYYASIMKIWYFYFLINCKHFV